MISKLKIALYIEGRKFNCLEILNENAVQFGVERSTVDSNSSSSLPMNEIIKTLL